MARTSKFSEELIASILKEASVEGADKEAIAKKHGVSLPTIYNWQKKAGGGMAKKKGKRGKASKKAAKRAPMKRGRRSREEFSSSPAKSYEELAQENRLLRDALINLQLEKMRGG